MMTEDGLRRKAREGLGLAVEFSLCRESLPLEALSSGERKIFSSQKHPLRRANWLRGRGALKPLLRRMGRSEDTALLSFPSPAFSLTHSHGIAIAAAVHEGAADGLGIDFEIHRPMRPETARFFLSEEERETLRTSSEPPERLLLRLWTVKEAVFKADPRNTERRLKSYRILNPMQWTGTAESRGDIFRYLSLELEEGFFSIAISRARD